MVKNMCLAFGLLLYFSADGMKPGYNKGRGDLILQVIIDPWGRYSPVYFYRDKSGKTVEQKRGNMPPPAKTYAPSITLPNETQAKLPWPPVITAFTLGWPNLDPSLPSELSTFPTWIVSNPINQQNSGLLLEEIRKRTHPNEKQESEKGR